MCLWAFKVNILGKQLMPATVCGLPPTQPHSVCEMTDTGPQFQWFQCPVQARHRCEHKYLQQQSKNISSYTYRKKKPKPKRTVVVV